MIAPEHGSYRMKVCFLILFVFFVPFVVQKLLFFKARKGREGAIEDAERIGYCNSIVGNGDARLATAKYSRYNLTPIQHARAAMNHHLIRAQIFWKIMPLHVDEFQVNSRVLPNPSWNFHSADVFSNRMMRARFKHQNAASRL